MYISTPSTPITVSFVPTEGDLVRTYKSNMAFYLGTPVGKGGEGTVYAIGKNLACKIFSLGKLRTITEEGVEFRSYIDGSKNYISPEISIDIQEALGSDIMMAFDECVPFPSDYEYTKHSMHLTHRWAQRCQNVERDNEKQHDCSYDFIESAGKLHGNTGDDKMEHKSQK